MLTGGAARDFFNSLLLCSHSKDGRDYLLRVSRRPSVVMEMCKPEDRTRRRELNELSCVGWTPHDRGSVSGLPQSKSGGRSPGRFVSSPNRALDLDIGARTFGSVRSILDNNLDRQAATKRAEDGLAIQHRNIRGPRYYH